ncbi:glycoside hydrolase family 16 protein [Pelagicoccus sp. SDUM812003]|uniref:glycoside hydrolase family 16 protein n=1 Tax=Pelagicoccus sp. SDUM812003 TaxID=3041267 RepID=UPI00280C9F26|nr:glycoside hydrolase family 16 protein [Pelagicoccus sp. SDUM812003]MDQ8204787.1 glycoside hydrolase family 16 protein [Pelagicoccus sp. SDUM812003]
MNPVTLLKAKAGDALLGGLALISPLSIVSSFAGEEANTSGWQLVWSDEFEVDGLPDPEKWGYDVGGHGWGNKELQYYTESRAKNARVQDGLLIIEAHQEPFQGSDYTSARLVTRDTANWTYGRFEIRARIPDGLGTWPAIWMLPVDWNLGSGNWPDVGEIDIMEHVGYDVGTIHASAHSKAYQWQIGTQKTGTIELDDATSAFHTYVLEWTEDVIRAYVDDTLYFEYENEHSGWEAWPYQRDYYLILNVAFGGAWGSAKGLDPDCLPKAMEVDYVRVYQQAEI